MRGAYFVKERQRHDRIRRVHLTYREAKAVARLLAAAYGLRVRFRRIIRGRNVGLCGRRGGEFVLRFRPWRPRGGAHDVVTLLTVVHEFAHALDIAERPRAFRRHCKPHAAWVDALAPVAVSAFEYAREAP